MPCNDIDYYTTKTYYYIIIKSRDMKYDFMRVNSAKRTAMILQLARILFAFGLTGKERIKNTFKTNTIKCRHFYREYIDRLIIYVISTGIKLPEGYFNILQPFLWPGFVLSHLISYFQRKRSFYISVVIQSCLIRVPVIIFIYFWENIFKFKTYDATIFLPFENDLRKFNSM